MSFWGSNHTGDKQFLSTQEILCDMLADGDKGKYINEVVPRLHKDAFGGVFFTMPDSKTMEILHPSEFFRLEVSCAHVKFYLLGPFDINKGLDSIVTHKENIFEIHDQIRKHYLKLIGISMMSLIVKLVLLSRYDVNDKNC